MVGQQKWRDIECVCMLVESSKKFVAMAIYSCGRYVKGTRFEILPFLKKLIYLNYLLRYSRHKILSDSYYVRVLLFGVHHHHSKEHFTKN